MLLYVSTPWCLDLQMANASLNWENFPIQHTKMYSKRVQILSNSNCCKYWYESNVCIHKFKGKKIRLPTHPILVPQLNKINKSNILSPKVGAYSINLNYCNTLVRVDPTGENRAFYLFIHLPFDFGEERSETQRKRWQTGKHASKQANRRGHVKCVILW